MDSDGNGKLDAGEFREAMTQLGGTSLSGESVSTIFEAMGIKGYITLDQFLDIAEVSERSAAELLHETSCFVRGCVKKQRSTCNWDSGASMC